MSVYEEIISARDQALSSIQNVADLSNLVDLEPALFGKKSALGGLKGLMGKLDASERASVGQALNQAQK